MLGVDDLIAVQDLSLNDRFTGIFLTVRSCVFLFIADLSSLMKAIKGTMRGQAGIPIS